MHIKRFFPLNKETPSQNLFILKTLFKTINFYKRNKLNFIFDSDTEKDMIKSMRQSKMTVLVAIKKEKIIGFVTFRDSGEHDESDREIQIFMLPRWRFKGYGERIILETEYFIFKNYRKVKTLSAQPTNPQIKSVLLKADWTPCCGGDCGDFIKFIR